MNAVTETKAEAETTASLPVPGCETAKGFLTVKPPP